MPDNHVPDVLKKKSELILNGTIVLDRKVMIPFPLSRSTAGPGAGSPALFLGFEGTRVKLRVSREKDASVFRLVPGDTSTRSLHARPGRSFNILKKNEGFIENVELVPVLMHAPEQAFINLDAGCRFGCLFCVSPHLRNYRRISNDRWVKMIRESAEGGNLRAIALTSGISGTIEESIRDFVYIIEKVRDTGVPIGVEPYVENRNQLQRLKDAGASELKLNIQSWDSTIFKVICPNLDHHHILRMLVHGVEIFGRNRVTSNIIIGLGETDANIIQGVEILARMGIAAIIRTIHMDPVTRPILGRALEIEPITRERLLYLREEQRRIFQQHEIDTGLFRTMCFPCKGCDLEVSW